MDHLIVEVTCSNQVTQVSDAFNKLLALNPDLTSAQLDTSMREAAGIEGLTCTQAVNYALLEAQAATSATAASSASMSSGQMSTMGNNPPCVKRDVGTSRFRGDIFWSASSTNGVPHGHMGIYYQTNVVIDARGKGILSGDFPVAGCQYCRNIEKMDVATSISTKNKAADYAHRYLRGKPCSSNFAWNKGGDTTDLNCSELVWKAHKRSVNIDLDGGGGLRVYPNDIKNSTKTRTYQVIS